MTEEELAKMYDELDTSEKGLASLEKIYREHGRLILAELLLFYRIKDKDRAFHLPRLLNAVDGIVDDLYEKLYDRLFIDLSVIYTRVLKATQYTSNAFTEAVQALINKVWAVDGKTLKTRFSGYSVALKQSIKVKLFDMIQGNVDSEKVIRAMQKEYGKHFYKMDIVVKTEVNRIINDGLKASFESIGYDSYRYSAILDSRTSKICRNMNGKVFTFAEAVHGVNFPPLHPFVEVSSSL